MGVLNHLKPGRPVTKIENLVVESRGMQDAAIKGFVAENLEAIGKEMASGTFEQAAKQGQPFIAIVSTGKKDLRHAVLVEKVEVIDGKQWVVVRDPDRTVGGAYREPLDWFENWAVAPMDADHSFQAIWAK